ncbi:MAG: hypothetical protein ABI877_04395 [Gemmatimonadaceae bacterium]
MINDSTPKFTPAAHRARVTVVRFRERIADTLSAILLVGGVALFLFARQSLASLANGTYPVPLGTSYVSRADVFATRSEIGLWLAAAGLALAIGAAMSHVRARRAGGRRRLASANLL